MRADLGGRTLTAMGGIYQRESNTSSTMSKFNDIIDKIHQGRNPYHEFPVNEWKGHFIAWGHEHPWFKEAIEELRPSVIVEVGTFLGGSAIHMAKHCKRLGLDTAICCVDTWLGSIDHLSQLHAELHYRWGRPSTYYHFMANAIEQGVSDMLVPVPTDSLNGMRWLKHHGITAPLVYIDGSHEEGDVYRDLVAYFIEILEPGGILLSDDMTGHFPGVVRDFEKFTDVFSLKSEINLEKARVRKPNRPA